eukprot:gene7436-9138_t
MSEKRKASDYISDDSTTISPAKFNKLDNEINERMNQIDDQSTFEELNPNTLKKLVLSFEKKYLKNQQMREKFKNNPEKFMESEIELDEEIKKLQIIATSPELYPNFVKLGSIVSLGSLLVHENSDIVIDAIDLFHELSQEEDRNIDSTLSLFHSMVENNIIETLVQCLNNLETTITEEQQAINNVLGIFENMMDLEPMITSQILSEKTNIFKYIISSISSKDLHLPIKLYCCEILSMILQQNTDSRKTFGVKYNGIETLLIAISQYKKNQPGSLEETEMVENIFTSLCASLFDEHNKKLFIKFEGIQLMLLIIKNKTIFRSSALKVLDYSLGKFKLGCEVFIDELGLRTLFSNFIKKVKAKHNKKVYKEAEDDEHIIGMINSLFRQLDKNSERYTRLVGKFTEDNYSKTDRLIELHSKYWKKVESVEKTSLDQVQDQEEREMVEEENFFKRLDAGLFKLQNIDVILLILCDHDPKLKEKILSQFKSQNILMNDFRNILFEYCESAEDSEKQFVQSLFEKL